MLRNHIHAGCLPVELLARKYLLNISDEPVIFIRIRGYPRDKKDPYPYPFFLFDLTITFHSEYYLFLKIKYLALLYRKHSS